MRFLTSKILIAFLAVLTAYAAPSFSDGNGYQQYYRFLNKYPDEVQNTGFHGEANGIAHDANYWYITNNHYDNVEALWKIPVTQSLYGISENTPGVSVVKSNEITCLTESGQKNLRQDLGYTHLGDLVAYEYNNQYYLLVPVEDGILGPAIAVLSADNPNQCLGIDVLRITSDYPSELNNASAWCAVYPEGYVYTSPNYWNFDDGVVKLFKYRLNWEDLGSAPMSLTYLYTIYLQNEIGDPLSRYEISGYAQGGEFSPDGRLLYVSAGDSGWDCNNEEYGGIHVFETQPSNTWRRVARSHSSDNTFFKYDYNCGQYEYEEPEGLTLWDLDEVRQSYLDPAIAPCNGQLHVLLLDNDAIDNDDLDDVYIYHYTNTIYVDHLYPSSADGTIDKPFRTVGNALAFYNQNKDFDYGHWTGGRIKIHSGSYNESITVFQRVQLAPWGGPASVGLQGRLVLSLGGAVNIGNGGSMKIH